MDGTTRASAFFIAVGIGVAGLYFFRDVLAPFAIAVFLWLIMDGFANALRRGTRRVIPRPVALLFAVVVVFVGAGVAIAVVTDSATEFARRTPDYVRRIDEVMSQAYAAMQLERDPPSLSQYLSEGDLGRFFGRIATAVRGLASNAFLVVIYVVFLFAAQATFPKKMDVILKDAEDRERVERVLGGVRLSMERYLAVQTFVSVLTAVTCYVTLRVLGLDNALFWAFLIFLLNYIPTVGSIVATILPTLFALVQYQTLWEPAAVFVGVGFWQALIGNFIQPRMQGENLNLATIVVLLGLVLWGAIWGVPGMFLSSPLTVTVMVLLAQSRSTRWIAVLLSADGRPEFFGEVRKGDAAAEAKPAET